MNETKTRQNNVYLGICAIAVSLGALLVAQITLAATTSSLLPTSDGTYLQWTPNSGVTHYTLVDEASCNGTTDYNSTNTVGNRDSYGVSLASVPNGSTITTIAVTPCASRNKSSSGSATMNVFYRFSGVNSADAGSYALTGTTPVQLASTTFTGLTHVKGSASTLEIGAVLSAGTRGARLSRIATVVTFTPLAAPTNLVAFASSSSQINLSWTDSATNETGFSIERSLNNSFGPFTQVATTTANSVSFSDSSVTADQTYYYRVRAFNTGGNSSYSNTAFAITATAVPADPTDLFAFASSTNASLFWSSSSNNESGFAIERSGDGIDFALIATTSPNFTSYADLSLASGTYYYRVQAYNAIGNSNYSNTASTTIP